MNPVENTYKLVRRVALTVVGVTVLGLGVVMIVTPGPAFVFIPVGLAILGLEFAWARIWLRKLRRKFSRNGARSHAVRSEQHRDRAMHR